MIPLNQGEAVGSSVFGIAVHSYDNRRYGYYPTAHTAPGLRRQTLSLVRASLTPNQAVARNRAKRRADPTFPLFVTNPPAGISSGKVRVAAALDATTSTDTFLRNHRS